MTNGAYAGLRRKSRAEVPSEEDELIPETENEEEAEDETEAEAAKKKEHHMTEQEHETAVAKAHAEGFAQANDRYGKVIASEHYAGREALAHKLLGNDKLGAEEIIDTLSAAEKKPEAAGDADETARAEMRDALARNTNSNIEAAAQGAPDKQAAAAAVWDAAISRMPGAKKAK